MDASKNLSRKLYNISKTTGKGAIYIYYSLNGKIKKFPTGVKVLEQKWDYLTEKPKRGSLTDSEIAIIDNLYNKVLDIITKYQFQYNTLPNIEHLEESLEKPTDKVDVFELFEDYVKYQESRNEHNTVLTYSTTLTALKKVTEHYKYKLTLDNFNNIFIQKFIDYHLTELKSANSTINLRIEKLISFVNHITDNDVKHTIKTSKWKKLKEEKIDLLCLEKNELEAIINYVPKNISEQKVKDIIIILSHTGMRKGDLKLINKENVVNGNLVFNPEKVKNVTCIVPISKSLKEVIERYNYKLPTLSKNYLNTSIQKLCKNIELLKKEIVHEGEKVPKHSVLTSHEIGRKTFINLCIQAAIPLPTLMGFTGHTKLDNLLKSYLDKHQNALPQLSKVFEF